MRSCHRNPQILCKIKGQKGLPFEASPECDTHLSLHTCTICQSMGDSNLAPSRAFLLLCRLCNSSFQVPIHQSLANLPIISTTLCIFYTPYLYIFHSAWYLNKIFFLSYYPTYSIFFSFFIQELMIFPTPRLSFLDVSLDVPAERISRECQVWAFPGGLISYHTMQ